MGGKVPAGVMELMASREVVKVGAGLVDDMRSLALGQPGMRFDAWCDVGLAGKVRLLLGRGVAFLRVTTPPRSRPLSLSASSNRKRTPKP
jgi:hypothetical protein